MDKAGIFFTLFLIAAGCNSPTISTHDRTINDIKALLGKGELLKAFHFADSLRRSSEEGSAYFLEADSLAQIAERTAIEFSLTQEEVISQIEKRIGSFSEEEMKEWESNGFLEYRVLNGRKMYFNRAVSNLMLLRKFAGRKSGDPPGDISDPETGFRLKHTSEIIGESISSSDPVVPVTMKITYTITVAPDVVPDGEVIRCWLPWPGANQPRHDSIKLLNTSQPDFSTAPGNATHNTIYMEKPAKKGVPSIFQISYTYRSRGQYFRPEIIKPLPYDTNTVLYRNYTTEQLPHIHFSKTIRHLADSLAGGETDPVVVVRNIYLWFKENIPWAGALEYSVMPDIPEYVLNNSRGDCGMQTFLFMSMLRYKGIPTRWQSGWMVPPGAENLHDWCEVFYEGTGWVPADVSYDLQPSENTVEKEFYLTGIDSYRLIVNNGIAGKLYPEKKFLRSEPFDFQRGEVEWRGGNLYFNKWDYDIKIEYLN